MGILSSFWNNIIVSISFIIYLGCVICCTAYSPKSYRQISGGTVLSGLNPNSCCFINQDGPACSGEEKGKRF